MKRQTSNHQETIRKPKNRAIVMITLGAFSPDITAAYARKMVELESRGNGDQMNAIDRVARKCGLGQRALRRLINGETKDPGLGVFGRVRAAYLDLCERHIERLKHDIETDMRVHGDAAFADLGHQIETLAEKVRQAKGR
jgi:hypothetical protein